MPQNIVANSKFFAENHAESSTGGDEGDMVTLTLRANVDFADTPTGGGTFAKSATTFISAAAEAIDPSMSGNEAKYLFSS